MAKEKKVEELSLREALTQWADEEILRLICLEVEKIGNNLRGLILGKVETAATDAIGRAVDRAMDRAIRTEIATKPPRPEETNKKLFNKTHPTAFDRAESERQAKKRFKSPKRPQLKKSELEAVKNLLTPRLLSKPNSMRSDLYEYVKNLYPDPLPIGVFKNALKKFEDDNIIVSKKIGRHIHWSLKGVPEKPAKKSAKKPKAKKPKKNKKPADPPTISTHRFLSDDALKVEELGPSFHENEVTH